MPKTSAEINEKIRQGKAVVVTAEEIIDIVKQKGAKKAAQEEDVVTTGTFGPMCSSDTYFNIGHAKPRIKLGGGRAYLNDVLAYTGFAAVDLFPGANALPDDDPRNRTHPGEFNYGGGHVIEELVAFSPEIIVENGGDIYLKSLTRRTVGIFAGNSPLTGKIGLEINAQDTPLGICTSSGMVGHSLSYGMADAVVALSESATLADAAATAIGNLVSQPGDITSAIEFGKSISGLKGLIIIKDANMGIWGEVKLCETSV